MRNPKKIINSNELKELLIEELTEKKRPTRRRKRKTKLQKMRLELLEVEEWIIKLNGL